MAGMMAIPLLITVGLLMMLDNVVASRCSEISNWDVHITSPGSPNWAHPEGTGYAAQGTPCWEPVDYADHPIHCWGDDVNNRNKFAITSEGRCGDYLEGVRDADGCGTCPCQAYMYPGPAVGAQRSANTCNPYCMDPNYP